MLRIRLTRTGKRHSPSYRIIVAEKRSRRDGRYVDIIGHYNPSENPVKLVLDKMKLEDWQRKGAQISEGVRKVFASQQ